MKRRQGRNKLRPCRRFVFRLSFNSYKLPAPQRLRYGLCLPGPFGYLNFVEHASVEEVIVSLFQKML